MKKHLGETLLGMLLHMGKSGEFYLNLMWVISLMSIGMDVRRAASIWMIMMSPQDIKIEDFSNNFFETISGTSNVCYDSAPQIALNHRVEECDINMTFHDDDEVPLEGDGKDVALQNIHEHWCNEV